MQVIDEGVVWTWVWVLEHPSLDKNIFFRIFSQVLLHYTRSKLLNILILYGVKNSLIKKLQQLLLILN